MTIFIYIVSGLFIALAVTIMFGYRRTQHAGLLLMSIIYGASGALALWNMQWWPLAAGFALVWIMRMLGMEPPAERRDAGGGRRAEGGRRKAEGGRMSD